MKSLECRVLKSVIDNKKCHVTNDEYTAIQIMTKEMIQKWLSGFVPTYCSGRKIRLYVG